jgi:ABC-type Na+ efflux pump permease subunit
MILRFDSAPLSRTESGMGKLMASCMVGSAAYLAASAFGGKSALESFGFMLLGYALSSIDGTYISKTVGAMGVDASKSLFWAAIQIATAAVIFV